MFSSLRAGSFVRLPLHALLLLFLASGLAHAASGEAVFVRGDVRVVLADGSSRPLKTSEFIQPGEQVLAGKDGYAHLRFPDGGFIGVRPGARFALEDYATDASAPGGVRVRYRLDSGSLRSITGQAVESNKNRFRLNTPVAAVGVRGTDYVVQASGDLTRASVIRGAIVMAPFGEGCEAAALGVCETAAARTLTAGATETYLEYRAGTAAPQIRKSTLPGLIPGTPDEPAIPADKRTESSVGTVDTTLAATVSRVGAVASALDSSLPAPLPASVPGSGSLPSSSDVVVAPPPPPEVVWGRWAPIAAGTPTVVEQLANGYQPAFSNPVFGLMAREPATDMPRQGVVGFNLTGSEAYVSKGANLTPMTVHDATLTVDFGARQFDTRLGVTGPNIDTQLSAAGNVTWQGYLASDATRSTMAVLGVLAGPAGRDAGYLFEKPLNSGAMLYGATSWRR